MAQLTRHSPPADTEPLRQPVRSRADCAYRSARREPATILSDIPRSRRRLTALTIFDPQRASRPQATFVGS